MGFLESHSSLFFLFFFLIFIRIAFSLTNSSRKMEESARKKPSYSLLPLPIVQKYWNLYLKLCIGDVYLVFFITVHVITSFSATYEIYLMQEIIIWPNFLLLLITDVILQINAVNKYIVCITRNLETVSFLLLITR